MSVTGASIPPDNEAIREQRDEVKKMNKPTAWTNVILVGSTLALVILTVYLVWITIVSVPVG